MSLRSRILGCAAFAIIALPLAAHAQDVAALRLTTGIWTGTVAPPNDGPVDITFEVTYKGDTLDIKLGAGLHGEFNVRDIELTPAKLSFSFTPGPVVVCVLTSNGEGGYGGECTDDGGSVVPMTMIPPAPDAKDAKEAKTTESDG